MYTVTVRVGWACCKMNVQHCTYPWTLNFSSNVYCVYNGVHNFATGQLIYNLVEAHCYSIRRYDWAVVEQSRSSGNR